MHNDKRNFDQKNSREVRKDFDVNVPENVATEFYLMCNESSCACLNRSGLKKTPHRKAIHDMLCGISTCNECEKEATSVGELKHFEVYQNSNVTTTLKDAQR